MSFKVCFSDENAIPVTNIDRRAIALAGAAKFYNQGYRGQGINIAVIDCGISPHPEFGNRVRWDLSKNFCLAYTDHKNMFDESGLGHGTQVASLIIGENCGIAPAATVTSLKVINGMSETDENCIINALTYVRDHAELFDVVNMSMGWRLSDMPAWANAKIETLVNQIEAQGIPFICAAGNTGVEQFLYPASYRSVISVGATDIHKKSCWFTTMNNEVDVAQVGADVTVATLNNGYIKNSGTSFAAPIVSGIAALLACKYKALFEKRIPEPALYEMIMMNTVDIEIKGIDKKSGCGLCTLGNGKWIQMVVGKREYNIDGIDHIMDVPVLLQDGRTFTPARFVTEPLGAEPFFTYQYGGSIIDIIG